MNYKNREDFLQLINDLNLKIGCEIGVYKGNFSIKILEKTNLSKLYLIDPWRHLNKYVDISNHEDAEFDIIFEDVKEKIEPYKDKIEIIRDLSENVVSNFSDNYFDFLYLDADHSYEASKKDVEMWYNKVKPGGIFSGHDYLNGSLSQGEFGVKKSIDEFVEKNNLILNITGEDEWKSWFIIKPKKQNINIVMYCTENYYETSINLIDILNMFHDNLNIYLYEINFDKISNIKNVNIINLEDKRIGNITFDNNVNDINNLNMFRAIFLKSKVILHSLKELELDEVVYLDSDLLPNNNISSLFDYFKKITNYPLIQEGPAEYLLIGDRGNPFVDGGFDATKILEYPIMEKLSIPIYNRIRYANASIVLYNANCLEFIEEYDRLNETTFDLNLEEVKYYYPFADETTINILLWKYKYYDRLPFLQVNINDISQVKEFFYSNYETDNVYSVFTVMPSKYEKPNKLFFHGIKNEMSKETYSFIKNFYLDNDNFNIKYETEENKIHISSQSEIEVEILIYEWMSISNNIQLLYNTTTHFNNNSFWYSTAKTLKELNGLKIEIKYNNRIIKEEYYKLKTIYGNNIKKQVIVTHSQVGIGDNLSATPAIKKISEIYNQKVILLTYIPSAFINNPYIESIVQINNEQGILNQYNSNDYNIHNFFNLMNTNWRLIDHKQLCAYNAGFQLNPDELDMQFYPDTFEPIENLPDRFICINPSETEPERTWGYNNWQKFIDLIQEHITVVAIGKETYLDSNLTKKFSNIEIKNGLNLLNHPSQNSLSQAYHIISKSETFVTMNNGLYILSLCNLDNHITELSTSWSTYFYRVRKGIENYNLNYIRGKCQIECLANPKISIDQIGTTQILKSGICYLNKPTYECHPTPEQVYESVLKTIICKKMNKE